MRNGRDIAQENEIGEFLAASPCGLYGAYGKKASEQNSERFPEATKPAAKVCYKLFVPTVPLVGAVDFCFML